MGIEPCWTSPRHPVADHVPAPLERVSQAAQEKQTSGRADPLVLTVKGRAAAVVQDPEAYQRLLDIAAQAQAEEGIRQGLEDVREGKVRPATEFFEEFETRYGLSR